MPARKIGGAHGLLILLISALTVATAQQTSSQGKTYTSPDGVFTFSYPANFPLCTKVNMEPCQFSFIPPCDPRALVCVVTPAGTFKDTSFGSAGFQAREVLTEFGGRPDSAEVCVTPSDRRGPPENFFISAEHPVETIDRVSFVHGVNGGVATGHSSSTDLYRAFHDGRCFELSIVETGTNPQNYDPPIRTPTPEDYKSLEQTLNGILHSFRFLK